MSRLQVLADRPRLALGALLTLLLAAAAVVGSGADFTASSANPSNTFASGTLSIVNSKEGVAVLTASEPPAGRHRRDRHGRHRELRQPQRRIHGLARSTPVDSDSSNPLSGKLNLTVVDCGTFAGATAPTCGDGDDVNKYTGTIAAMTGNKALGTYAGSEKHRYLFTVALDTSAGNVYQGDNSSVEFDWNAA